MSFLEHRYAQRCATPSDIYEHLPTLRSYATGCKHVTECGVRSAVSSYAFATALRATPGARLVLVDVDGSPAIDQFLQECQHEGLSAQFHKESDLTCPMEPTDLLFIDTWHIYGHLKRELARWNSSVAKYIILHDTEVDRIHGETVRMGMNAVEQSARTGIPVEEILRGLWPAVEEFLAAHPEWRIKEHFKNCNGLTVLERLPPS